MFPPSKRYYFTTLGTLAVILFKHVVYGCDLAPKVFPMVYASLDVDWLVYIAMCQFLKLFPTPRVLQRIDVRGFREKLDLLKPWEFCESSDVRLPCWQVTESFIDMFSVNPNVELRDHVAIGRSNGFSIFIRHHSWALLE